MKSVVIGSEGVVGRPFCEYLLAQGEEVVRYDVKRGPGFTSTGIDIDATSIEQPKAKGIHDVFIFGDFMTTDLQRTFDVVALSHVIEHFDRDTGLRVLQRLEQLSSCLIYVETPNGFPEQTDCDGNPYQRHLSGWFPHDFESRGCTVFGSGPNS
jgi:nucleoside-diphosphate-sugar epimerase